MRPAGPTPGSETTREMQRCCIETSLRRSALVQGDGISLALTVTWGIRELLTSSAFGSGAGLVFVYSAQLLRSQIRLTFCTQTCPDKNGPCPNPLTVKMPVICSEWQLFRSFPVPLLPSLSDKRLNAPKLTMEVMGEGRRRSLF